MRFGRRAGSPLDHGLTCRGRRPLVVGAMLAGLLTVLLPAGSSSAATAGTLVVGGVTRPAGGVWLPGPGTSPGHFWTPDGVLGLCRVDPSGSSFTLSHCQPTVPVGGQAAYDSGHRLLYVADASSPNDVVRFSYDQAGEQLLSPVRITVPPAAVPVTTGGKGKNPGTAAGRAMSLALTPDGSMLFVGYAKSGDISALTSVFSGTSTTAPMLPTRTSTGKVGVTTDGRGSSGGLAVMTHAAGGVLHTDLYVGEIGGRGLSVIPDVAGTPTRPACGSPGPCTAVTVTTSSGAAVSSTVGALATDGTVLYVGDAPGGLPGKVLVLNPATGIQSDWSTSVPAYTSSFDGVRRTTYTGITGLGTGPGGLVYVGDDPTVAAARPTATQGHLWRVAPPTGSAPTITALSPASGPTSGGTAVTVSGTNLVVNGAPPTIAIGSARATSVTCADTLTCTAVVPPSAGAGAVDVVVTTSAGQVNATPGRFTYVVVPPTNPTSPPPVVTRISPARGLAAGGTVVTVQGTDLAPAGSSTSVAFGPDAAVAVSCNAAGSACTATTPVASGPGAVDVRVITSSGGTSGVTANDRFEFVAQPVAELWAYGVTAPAGGMVWVPNGRPGGGQWWSADHVQGLCRMDPVPGAPLHALNSAACDPGFALGSPGQAVWDPRPNADGTHWVYVPDNAHLSRGVSRIAVAVDARGLETLVGTPEVLAPGATHSMAGLKPNGMALGPDGNLYVGDLVDGVIRRIVDPARDVRTQRVDEVAITQTQRAGKAARGINGTVAFVGTRLFLPENNGASYVDISPDGSGTWDPAVGAIAACDPFVLGSCPSSTMLDFLPVPGPVFVAGIAADPVHHQVYISSAPGAAPATVFRVDTTTITADRPAGSAGVVYVTSGRVPATSVAGAPNPAATVWCSLTCTRPVAPDLVPGGTTGFSFAQGLMTDPADGTLYVAEDVTAGARGGRGHVWSVPYLP